MRITAKYSSKCVECGEPVMVGDRVMWEKSWGGVVCIDCWENVNEQAQDDEPSVCDECGGAHYGSTCRRCDSEYAAGVADANRYLENRRMFGDEMAERMEIEQEMRGLDW